jgi:hypothetical protein
MGWSPALALARARVFAAESSRSMSPLTGAGGAMGSRGFAPAAVGQARPASRRGAPALAPTPPLTASVRTEVGRKRSLDVRGVECGSGAARRAQPLGPGSPDHRAWGRLMQSAARSMP